MSYTTLIALYPDKPVHEIAEFKNAMGSAPVIWNALAMHHLGLEDMEVWFHREALWALSTRPDLPDHHRALLLMTCDDAVIVQADFQRAAADIRAFLADFPPEPTCVNHWTAIAEALAQADCPYIGFWMTSVGDNPFLGEWNEEAQDFGPANLRVCWDVYEHQREILSARAHERAGCGLHGYDII